MPWQDIVLTIGTVLFSVALVPSLFSEDKPALATSLMTGTILFCFAVVYSTLGLWFSAVAVTSTGIIWYILLFQSLRKKSQDKESGDDTDHSD